MPSPNDTQLRAAKMLRLLAFSNALIWVIALIGLVIVISRDPAAKGLFPVLAGGCAVGMGVISALPRV
jgi:hypothetical protein